MNKTSLKAVSVCVLVATEILAGELGTSDGEINDRIDHFRDRLSVEVDDDMFDLVHWFVAMMRAGRGE
jgi:hypothetical protein